MLSFGFSARGEANEVLVHTYSVYAPKFHMAIMYLSLWLRFWLPFLRLLQVGFEYSAASNRTLVDSESDDDNGDTFHQISDHSSVISQEGTQVTRMPPSLKSWCATRSSYSRSSKVSPRLLCSILRRPSQICHIPRLSVCILLFVGY